MRAVRQIYRANSRHWVGDGFWVQPLFSHMGEDRGTDPDAGLCSTLSICAQ